MRLSRCGRVENTASGNTALCYRTSLTLTKEHGWETVAFPLISSGIFGYSKEQVLCVAVDTIGDSPRENDTKVYIVIFDCATYQIFRPSSSTSMITMWTSIPTSGGSRCIGCHKIEESIVCEESASFFTPMAAVAVSGFAE